MFIQYVLFIFFFFFQAEDGIRDGHVTGVQTCALPISPDRLVALDAISVVIISSTALMSILFQTSFLIEIILLIAIMSFIGTVAFSKFIEKGRIIERDHNS